MVETHADAMRRLGVALRNQEGEEGPEQGQRSGIPPGTDNGRNFVANREPVNLLAMGLKGLSVKHGGFDDRDFMLQTLIRRIQDLRQRHAEERRLHRLHVRHISHDWNLAERLRQRMSQTVLASDHRRQDKVLTLKQGFRADRSHSPETHHRQVQWFHARVNLPPSRRESPVIAYALRPSPETTPQGAS